MDKQVKYMACWQWIVDELFSTLDYSPLAALMEAKSSDEGGNESSDANTRPNVASASMDFEERLKIDQVICSFSTYRRYEHAVVQQRRYAYSALPQCDKALIADFYLQKLSAADKAIDLNANFLEQLGREGGQWLGIPLSKVDVSVE